MARVPKPRFKEIESLTHDEAKRRNIPTAEMQALYEREAAAKPVTISYPRATPLQSGERRERNRDLDPQLVWRGKDEQDWSDLVVHAPPLYIQEKVHPKVIIEDLRREAQRRRDEADDAPDLFADFNGLPDTEARLEFYQHDQNWSNRMILGDSLQVMASLAEREGLRGQVQCIYIDPPYGIRFNSNWQVSTRSRDVKDGSLEHISREPEQIKAFRDTWQDGIHSYLTYLRDRLIVARDLLNESGAMFVQIGDQSIHRIRSLMDEIMGEDNFIALIALNKTSGLQSGTSLPSVLDYIVCYAKKKNAMKFRPLFIDKRAETDAATEYFYLEDDSYQRRALSDDERSGRVRIPPDCRLFSLSDLTKPGPGRKFDFVLRGNRYSSGNRWWGTPPESLTRVAMGGRIYERKRDIRFIRFLQDFPVRPINNY